MDLLIEHWHTECRKWIQLFLWHAELNQPQVTKTTNTYASSNFLLWNKHSFLWSFMEMNILLLHCILRALAGHRWNTPKVSSKEILIKSRAEENHIKKRDDPGPVNSKKLILPLGNNKIQIPKQSTILIHCLTSYPVPTYLSVLQKLLVQLLKRKCNKNSAMVPNFSLHQNQIEDLTKHRMSGPAPKFLTQWVWSKLWNLVFQVRKWS